MSNLIDGGVAAEQKIKFIAEGLEEVTADILDLVYRIVFYSLSGLE